MSQQLQEPTSVDVAAPRAASGAIDTDVHPNFRDGMRDLAPYMDPVWVKRLGIGGQGVHGGRMMGTEFRLPISPYVHSGGALRPDATPPDGGMPASDPQFVVEQLLDRFDYAAAVLLTGEIITLSGFPDPDVGAAVASASNRWLSEVWLSVDPRFKGSIVVGPRDPVAAVKEIERWADHPSMVQVFVPTLGGTRLGNRHFWPIFEASAHFGLPVALHPGGEASGVNGQISSVGPPKNYFEYHASHSTVYQAQLISLIVEGVFERFPGLRFIFLETGFAWLTEVMWRLDQKWHALRDEVPWLTRLPSEYVLESVRASTQPMYEPANRAHLGYLLEMVHADQVLCYSSDYPHWDTDDLPQTLKALPAEMRRRIMIDTPTEFYGL